MTVVSLVAAPPRLRGLLTRWFVEVGPGLYVGRVSARVREELVRLIQADLSADACAQVIWADGTQEQGWRAWSQGDRLRRLEDVDGLLLAVKRQS